MSTSTQPTPRRRTFVVELTYNNRNALVVTPEKAKAFGDFLYDLRLNDVCISRVEAARKMNISYGYLSIVELGYPRVTWNRYRKNETYVMPTREFLKKIAKAYRDAITYDELLVAAGYPLPVKRSSN